MCMDAVQLSRNIADMYSRILCLGNRIQNMARTRQLVTGTMELPEEPAHIVTVVESGPSQESA
jgi:hypothetical protein